ncbi:MAG: hypothetical protein AAGG44_13385, partial [Planctomycetota bacterium]
MDDGGFGMLVLTILPQQTVAAGNDTPIHEPRLGGQADFEGCQRRRSVAGLFIPSVFSFPYFLRTATLINENGSFRYDGSRSSIPVRCGRPGRRNQLKLIPEKTMPLMNRSTARRCVASAACLSIAIAVSPLPVFAQEARIQVLGVGGDDVPEGIRESVLDGVSSMSFSMASPGGNISFGGGPMGGINPNNQSQLFQLLSNESVRKELDLSEEQIVGVETIQKATQKRFSELLKAKLMAGGPGGPISLGGDDFQKIMDQNREQAEAAIEEILLPKQMDRIRQLAYQIDIQQNGGIGEALTTGRLGEEIGVHEDQK